MLYLAADPNDEAFMIILQAGKGELSSASLIREFNPSLHGAVSRYEVLHQDKEKERVFEQVRISNYPNQPSRLGAIFLFPDLSTAKRVDAMWWGGHRNIHEATIIQGYKVLRADSQWLNCTPENYTQNAHNYFKGALSPDPIVEIVVMGTIRVNLEPIIEHKN